MKEIQLTRCKVALVDDEDCEKLAPYNWQAGVKSTGIWYARRGLWDTMSKTMKAIHMHREIMNCPEDMVVDHINGNGLDNRKENLRVCTHAQNCLNSERKNHCVVGMKGVHFTDTMRTNPWRAIIRHNHKNIHLGYFPTKELARTAYTTAAEKYNPEFRKI